MAKKTLFAVDVEEVVRRSVLVRAESEDAARVAIEDAATKNELWRYYGETLGLSVSVRTPNAAELPSLRVKRQWFDQSQQFGPLLNDILWDLRYGNQQPNWAPHIAATAGKIALRHFELDNGISAGQSSLHEIAAPVMDLRPKLAAHLRLIPREGLGRADRFVAHVNEVCDSVIRARTDPSFKPEPKVYSTRDRRFAVHIAKFLRDEAKLFCQTCPDDLRAVADMAAKDAYHVHYCNVKSEFIYRCNVAATGEHHDVMVGWWDFSVLGGVSVAHRAARMGKLPDDFDEWTIATDTGWTVAHEAAYAGTLPASFVHFELADSRGVTVGDVAAEMEQIQSPREERSQSPKQGPKM